jgi:hypothetical protein
VVKSRVERDVVLKKGGKCVEVREGGGREKM